MLLKSAEMKLGQKPGTKGTAKEKRKSQNKNGVPGICIFGFVDGYSNALRSQNV
jgi:hypothetical protein